jgi:hypothetical protein
MPRGGVRRDRYRAGRKRRVRAMREQKFYARWVIHTMSPGVQGAAEWRVRYVTGPDERSLTGRAFGDPRWGRSALYGRAVSGKPTLEQEFQLTGGLAL